MLLRTQKVLESIHIVLMFLLPIPSAPVNLVDGHISSSMKVPGHNECGNQHQEDLAILGREILLCI